MSFIDWIPVASTIKHLTDDPKGTKVSDYTCHMDNSACGGDPALEYAAILACKKDIDQQLLGYIKNYINVQDAFLRDITGDIVAVVIAYLAKRSIARAAGLSLPVVGAILALDTFVDLGVVITKLNQMRRACERAKKICCKCSEGPCSNAKQNNQPLVIKRWYFGPDRSLRKTKTEAQRYAYDHYTCKGGCEIGNCKPKIDVVDWSQRGFGLIQTTVKYDVYCKCPDIE